MVEIAFGKDISSALKQICEQYFNSKVSVLAKANKHFMELSQKIVKMKAQSHLLQLLSAWYQVDLV